VEPHARNSRAREANQKARSTQGFSSDQERSRNDNTVIFTWFGCSDEIRASAQHLARKPILKNTPKTTKEPANGPIGAKQGRSIERVLLPIIGSFVFSVRWRVTASHRNQRKLKVGCKLKIRNCHDQFVLVHSLLTCRTERNGARTPTDRDTITDCTCGFNEPIQNQATG